MEGHDNPLRVEPVQRLLTSAKILNKSLQQICAKEGLNKTGVKADFQNRIIGSKLWWGGDNSKRSLTRNFPFTFLRYLTTICILRD